MGENFGVEHCVWEKQIGMDQTPAGDPVIYRYCAGRKGKWESGVTELWKSGPCSLAALLGGHRLHMCLLL